MEDLETELIPHCTQVQKPSKITVAYTLNTIASHMTYDAVLRQDVATIERALGR